MFNEPPLVCRLNREHINQGYYIAFRRNRDHSVASFRVGRNKARAASRHSMKRGAAAGTTAAGRGLDGSRDVGRQRTALNPITDGNCLPIYFGSGTFFDSVESS